MKKRKIDNGKEHFTDVMFDEQEVQVWKRQM